MALWNNTVPIPSGSKVDPSPLTLTFSGSTIQGSTNGVSAGAATSASPTTRTPSFTTPKSLPRTISVTSTSSAASYTTGNIVITGTDVFGNTITETLNLTATGGGETVKGKLGFVTVTQIDIPAMGNTSGNLSFGYADVMCPNPPRQIRVGTAGSGALHVGYGYSATSGALVQDTIVACTAGERFDITPRIIYADSTVQDVTLFF